MKQLIKKYRNNSLSQQELDILRQQMAETDDEQLAVLLENDWQDADIDVSLADSGRLEAVKERLMKETHQKQGRGVIYTLFKYAAIILIPLLMASTVYYYMKSKTMLDEGTVVSTGKGESATVCLPDGSNVTIFYESRLEYQQSSFNKDIREVNFDGEAHFKVKQDKEHPFVIDNEHLKVTVLGTVFSLAARKTDTRAEVYLEEGKVSLQSPSSGKTIVMKPQDRATIDYATGEITIEHLLSCPMNISQGYLTFDSTPLSKVTTTVGANFGCNVSVADKSLLSKTFSGSLPSKNINEALEVLCLSFELKVKRVGNKYTLY